MTAIAAADEQRIVVVGPSCSGKSTLGAQLAQALGIPFVELDALFWKPGWTEPADEEFRAKLSQATAGDKWVVAGGYFRHSSVLIWPRTQMVIWLDFPMRTVLPRIVARSWRRWRSGELLWGTNTEKFWPQLKLWDQRSLVAFTFSHRQQTREWYIAAMADRQWGHIRFVRLCSPAQVRDFARSFAGMVPERSAREA